MAPLNKKLEKILRSRVIVLLDVSWLQRYEGERLPCRQHLPDEALVPYDEISFGLKEVIALSYTWRSQDHPDPDRNTLEQVQKCLSSMPQRFRAHSSGKRGLFWDYASLYQKPRSEEQTKIFHEGLSAIPFLFMHPEISVLRVMEVISTEEVQGHNQTPYLERGWPFAEYCWSSLVKNDVATVLDVGKIEERRKRLLRAPQVPARFNGEIDGKSFSCGDVDVPRVKQLYRESFEFMFEHVRYLDFGGLEWGDEVALQLIELFQGDYVPHLKVLKLSRNRLGVPFCQSLVGCLHQQLDILDLSWNPIGTEGAVCLVPVIMNVARVEMRCVDLSLSGYADLIERLAESIRNVEEVKSRPLVELETSFPPVEDGFGVFYDPLMESGDCTLTIQNGEIVWTVKVGSGVD